MLLVTKSKRRQYGNKYAHKPDMTKEEVITELRRLQSAGHSMKSGDFEGWFYRRIAAHFGGYMQAKRELGIAPERKAGGGFKRRNLNEVIEETRYAVTKASNMSEFLADFRHLTDYSRIHHGSADEIFKIAGVKKPPNKLPPKRGSIWTVDRIKETLSEVVERHGSTAANHLKNNGDGAIVGAVRKEYGTWNAGLVALGYEVAMVTPKNDWTKELARETILRALADGVSPVRTELERYVSSTVISRLFSSIADLKEFCGFCAMADRPTDAIEPEAKYTPKLSTRQGIEREIIRMWYVGSPLSYTYVSSRRPGILAATNREIGSWRQAVEGLGIAYSNTANQNDSNVLSECGEEFENVFADILNELGETYVREGEGLDTRYMPDFVFPDGGWLDCKLSEWTDTREMLIKYHSEDPNGITVVYLRGPNRRITRGRKWVYEHVSVYQYTQMLTQPRRSYYEGILTEIENKANGEAVAS